MVTLFRNAIICVMKITLLMKYFSLVSVLIYYDHSSIYNS